MNWKSTVAMFVGPAHMGTLWQLSRVVLCYLIFKALTTFQIKDLLLIIEEY